jgi:hypothetical protein
VVIRTPGIDDERVRQAEDRNYIVLTLDRERITRMRACRNRDEARSFAGITRPAPGGTRLSQCGCGRSSRCI